MQDDLIRDINKKISELESVIRKKDLEITDLKQQLKKSDIDLYDRYGFQFTKKVIYYISQGIEEDRAILLAWDDFPALSCNNAFMIWNAARPIKSGLRLYARTYCAHKMKSAGYKRFEIACTLGLSLTTISKLLRCKILF